jgi:hypothetical protein
LRDHRAHHSAQGHRYHGAGDCDTAHSARRPLGDERRGQRRQAAKSDARGGPPQEQLAETSFMGAQQRTDGQGQQAGDEGALATHPVAEPAEHYRSDGHADQAAGQDPNELGACGTPVGHDGRGDE